MATEGQIIRKWRNEAGLSLESLAEEIRSRGHKADKGTLSQLENSARDSKTTTKKNACEALGKSLADLRAAVIECEQMDRKDMRSYGDHTEIHDMLESILNGPEFQAYCVMAMIRAIATGRAPGPPSESAEDGDGAARVVGGCPIPTTAIRRKDPVIKRRG